MNYIKEYLTEIESDGKSQNTVTSFTNTIQMFFRWKTNCANIFVDSITNNQILEVKVDDVRKYKIYMSKMYKNTGSNTKLSYLKGFWNWLRERGYVQENIFAGVKMFEEPYRTPISMEISEVEELLSYVKSVNHKHTQRDYVLLSVLLSSGLRIGEVLAIKPNMVTVEQLEDGNSYGLSVVGKGNKQRETILTEKVYNELQKFINKRKISEDEKIFTVSARTVERNLKKYLIKSGLDTKYTPHKLRHTFATMLYESDVQIEEISKYLGHESTSTTTDFYVKISGKQRRKASRLHPLNSLNL